jgi:hypothetical protein
MPNSNYLDTQLNKLAFGATAFTPPATIYIGLSTTTPTQAGTGITEPVGSAYARVAVVNNVTNWVAQTAQPGTGQGQANGTIITFPAATGAWGTVTYLVAYDAAAAGNFLGFGILATPQAVGTGNTPAIAVQAFTIQQN